MVMHSPQEEPKMVIAVRVTMPSTLTLLKQSALRLAPGEPGVLEFEVIPKHLSCLPCCYVGALLTLNLLTSAVGCRRLERLIPALVPGRLSHA